MEILWLLPHILNLKKINRLMICVIFSKLKTLTFLVLWSQLTLDWIFKDCEKKIWKIVKVAKLLNMKVILSLLRQKSSFLDENLVNYRDLNKIRRITLIINLWCQYLSVPESHLKENFIPQLYNLSLQCSMTNLIILYLNVYFFLHYFLTNHI